MTEKPEVDFFDGIVLNPTYLNNDEDPQPIGTPERALILVLDAGRFKTLSYAGRFFYAEIGCNGNDGEELGILTPADILPGYYVFEGGKTWECRDWETGVIHDYGLDGTWRPATFRDFAVFNVEPPFKDLIDTIIEFRDRHEISCPESIVQNDRVIEGACDFIENLLNGVGYFKHSENEK